MATCTPSSWRRVLVLGLVSVVGAGCIFGGTRRDVAVKEAESRASSERNAAIARGDFAVALAYDDAFLVRSGENQDAELRAERKNHFVRLMEATRSKLGPLSGANSEAVFGTLVAFRLETRRDLSVPAGEPPVEGPFAAEIAKARIADRVMLNAAGTKLRQADLALVDADLIMPQLVDAAAVLWTIIDAAAARKEYASAILLATAVVAELPPGNEYVARLAQLEQTAAAVHVASAQQAGEVLPGARVLHARIAAIYGAQVGPLKEPGPGLLAETRQDWTIVSPGSCGDSIDSARATTKNLAARLEKSGFASGTGQPLRLTVTFDACPVTVHDSQAEVRIPYQEIQIQTVKIEVPDYSCSTATYSSTSSVAGDHVYTTTTTTPGKCTRTGTSYREEKHEVLVDLVEKVAVSHREHRMSATGTIQIVSPDGTREERFSLDAQSDDDPAWTSVRRPSKSREGHTEMQVRDRMHDDLLVEIRALTGKVLAVRAAAHTAKAKVSVAAGQTLEADHSYFIANEINLLAGVTDPAFTQWIEATYRVPALVLAAAIAEQARPTQDLAKGHRLALAPMAIMISPDAESELTAGLTARARRSLLHLTLTAGPSSASTAGGSGSIIGGIASFAFTGFGRNAGGGFRISGGVDQKGSGLVDIDFIAGGGVQLGWLKLNALVGVGGDFTPGNQDGAAPTPASFMVPAGAYAEYGARASYAFYRAATLELIYTKAFRTASALPREKRGDVRLAIVLPGGFPAGLTMRYAEYLTESDGFFSPFGAEHRAARTFWALVGVGF